MKFHENLQRLRKNAGLSQEDVAQKLYVSRQSVSKWENGGAEPGIANLKALAVLYGVSVDELLGGVTEETKEKTENGYAEKLAWFGYLAMRIVMVMAFWLVCVEYGYTFKDRWYAWADLFLAVPGIWLLSPVLWVILMCMQAFSALFGLYDLITMASMPGLMSVFFNLFCVIVLYSKDIRKRFHAERY